MTDYIAHMAIAFLSTGVLIGLIRFDLLKLWMNEHECLRSEPDLRYVEGSDNYELDRYFRSIRK